MGAVIDGVLVTPLKEIFNPKGNILHVIKKDDPGYVEFGEVYFSTIQYRLIKAWKRHLRMTLNLVCPVGGVRFILYDDRPFSATSHIFQEIVLSRKTNYARLTIPPGVWMGFEGIAQEESIILNFADIKHDPNEQENVPMEISHIQFDWEKSYKI
jgi:dTDP-4-dehydrorhamnose 3,5-epimerase